MGIVKASQSIAIVHKGVDYMVIKGQTYDTDHPLVKGHPGLFEELTADVGVEQATAGPGERRNR